MVRRTMKKGFTLVEILIVVIILGILAAIVIPQFTNASTDARKANMASQLQTMKSQIALYKLQHNDAVPSDTSATFWNQLTQYTDIAGAASATNTAGTVWYGPYMPEKAVNPITNASDVVAVGSPALTAGWTYTSGVIHGIVKNTAGAAVESDDGYHDLTGSVIP